MADDKDLLDRISKISGMTKVSPPSRLAMTDVYLGQINVHRTHITSSQPSLRGTHANGSRNTSIYPAAGNTVRGSHRVTPYPRGNVRGGRVAPISHRHRSLILSNKTNTAPSNSNSDHQEQDPGYVTKHDRHMQLINTSIYDQKTQQRNKAIEESRQRKINERDLQEKQKIRQHVHANIPRAANGLYKITVNGIQFSVINDGTKLERVRGRICSLWRNCGDHLHFQDSQDPARPTPKQADVGGVKFFRTTNGNLLRNGVAKVKR